ncbi:deaminase [Lysinibacillus fusiformis]|uniref:deaminase n=1 Tax=Lysinibacillus fusiformis TaxID=28031 RepID=UPI001F4E941C|nr:deaminase [Lysinibacillus fusiformis]MCK1989225.1 deaminase [Lysinibacillus fusiformis]
MYNENLKKYLNRPVSELIRVNQLEISEGQKERHRLYSLLLMSIAAHYWNGNKYGRVGDYPLNEQDVSKGKYLDKDYLGHNIVALAVDAVGNIIDFDFNHNEIFNRSTEHAEIRTIQRIYKLTQIHDSWIVDLNKNKSKKSYTTFEDVSIYTSLESCSQCSGVMALAKVKEVIYLQQDPTMYMIGNIIRNLTEGTELEAPQPIPGSSIELEYYEQLNRAYEEYLKVQKVIPFFIPHKGTPKENPSITSFLCTKSAYDIYINAKEKFEQLLSGKIKLKFKDYKPNKKGSTLVNALSNQQVLKEVSSFYHYAKELGRRGTPH